LPPQGFYVRRGAGAERRELAADEPDIRTAPVVTMSEDSALDMAVKRLALALDALDAAVERRREADRGTAALAQQVQALGLDRSKLAVSLDGEAARVRKLEDTNRDIAQRLDTAIASIRSVLDEQGQ
jgi:hypothetical protein